jgi:Basic region leucine zipper
MNNTSHQPIIAMTNPLGFTDLFSGMPTDTGKSASFDSLLDAWLANDLTQAGLLPPVKEEVASPFLVSSPLTASPTNESISDCSQGSTPLSSANSVMEVPFSDQFVALFPDIGMAHAAVMPSPPKQKALAPRTAPKPALIAPKPPTPIAPRPITSPMVIPDTARLSTYTGKRARDYRQNSTSSSSGSDEPDEIALKRQKNTDAARRSRLKKLVKMETLETQVSELEADNSKLNTRVAVLESEKNGLEAKERSLEERVRNLEAQLAEAHKALTSINKH